MRRTSEIPALTRTGRPSCRPSGTRKPAQPQIASRRPCHNYCRSDGAPADRNHRSAYVCSEVPRSLPRKRAHRFPLRKVRPFPFGSRDSDNRMCAPGVPYTGSERLCTDSHPRIAFSCHPPPQRSSVDRVCAVHTREARWTPVRVWLKRVAAEPGGLPLSEAWSAVRQPSYSTSRVSESESAPRLSALTAQAQLSSQHFGHRADGGISLRSRGI